MFSPVSRRPKPRLLCSFELSQLTHTRPSRPRHLTVGRAETIVRANFPDTADVERCYLSCRASVRAWDGR